MTAGKPPGACLDGVWVPYDTPRHAVTRRFGDGDDDVCVRRAPLKATVLSPLRGGLVYEKIVGHVRDGILAGRLKPGDRLPPERELVRQFRVGRGAIREAFRILEQSALIRIRPGKGGGAFVAGRPSAAVTRSLSDLLRFGGISLDDVVEARVALEGFVIDIIANQADTDDLARLADSVERAARFFEEGRRAEKREENFNFHVLLAEGHRVRRRGAAAKRELTRHLREAHTRLWRDGRRSGRAAEMRLSV